MPKKINSIIIILTLQSIEKIKTEKQKTTKQSDEYFFHQRCKKTATNTVFDWILTSYDYLILTFHWLISAGPPNCPFQLVQCATKPDKVIINSYYNISISCQGKHLYESRLLHKFVSPARCHPPFIFYSCLAFNPNFYVNHCIKKI